MSRKFSVPGTCVASLGVTAAPPRRAPRRGGTVLAGDRDAVERVDRDEQPAEGDVLLLGEDAADVVVHLVGDALFVDEHVALGEFERRALARGEDARLAPGGDLGDLVGGQSRRDRAVDVDAHAVRAAVQLRRVDERDLLQAVVDAGVGRDRPDGLREGLQRVVGGRAERDRWTRRSVMLSPYCRRPARARPQRSSTRHPATRDGDRVPPRSER
jgi:hypothetical protein